MVGDFWNGRMRTSINLLFHQSNENTSKMIKINFLELRKLAKSCNNLKRAYLGKTDEPH